MQYIATSHPASSVGHALKCHFLASDALDLVVCKHTRIEVYSLDGDATSLKLKLTIPVNGTILAINALQLKSAETASLLVLTATNHFFAVKYDQATQTVRTESSVSVQERAGRAADFCQAIAIDPLGTFVGLHTYNGLFRVVPLVKDTKRRKSSTAMITSTSDNANQSPSIDLERGYNIRLPDYNVHDLTILNLPNKPPILALLHDNHLGQKSLKIRPVLLAEKDFSNDADSREYILDDPGSEMLIAIQNQGILVIGEEQAVFVDLSAEQLPETKKAKGKARSSSDASLSSPVRPTKRRGSRIDKTVTCRLPIGVYTSISEIEGVSKRYLLGDIHGGLHVLALQRTENRITSMTFQECGSTSSSKVLVSLSDSLVYVGSHYGDSQLIRLSAPASERQHTPMEIDEDEEAGSSRPIASTSKEQDISIEILQTFTNLAPIVDMTVVENEHQSHVVTCSGAYNDGSIRIVSHGVGLNELASLDLDNVQRLFPLRHSGDDGLDEILVLSFVNETRLLKFGQSDDDIEELPTLPGFDLTQATLDAFSFQGVAYQVTKTAVTSSNGHLFTPPDKQGITVAAHFDGIIVIALSGGNLIFLHVANGFSNIESLQMSEEVACLAISNTGSKRILTVGLWSVQEIQLIDCDTRALLSKVVVPSTFLIRAALISKFEDDCTALFVGLGDGSLVSYNIRAESSDGDMIEESSRKTVVLGTRPVLLNHFRTEDGAAILANSDSPTIISRLNGRLNYSSVSLRGISAFTQFNSTAFQKSLVLASNDTVRIGRIEGSQKMHIRTILLGADQPRRISWSTSLRAYGILCIKEILDRSTGTEIRTSSFKVVNETFDILFDFDLDDEEHGMAVCVAQLGSPATDHFVIGCSTTLPNEKQSRRGRILAFGLEDDGSYKLVGEADAKGAPYALAPLSSARLAATVNAELIVYELRKQEKVLHALNNWGGTFLATTLATEGDLILVGDALRSAVLLQINANNQLHEVAREYSAHGILSLAFLGQEKFIATDVDLNMFTMQKASAQLTDRKDQILQQAGLFHIGEVVTVLRKGSLVPKFAQSISSDSGQLLYATSAGSIGVICGLDNEKSTGLSNLQRNMQSSILSVGNIERQEWRKFRDETRVLESVGFVDGDFIEQWSDLTGEQVAEVLKGRSEAEALNFSPNAISALVEDAGRMS